MLHGGEFRRAWHGGGSSRRSGTHDPGGRLWRAQRTQLWRQWGQKGRIPETCRKQNVGDWVIGYMEERGLLRMTPRAEGLSGRWRISSHPLEPSRWKAECSRWEKCNSHTCCVTLGKLLSMSGPWFAHLKKSQESLLPLTVKVVLSLPQMFFSGNEVWLQQGLAPARSDSMRNSLCSRSLDSCEILLLGRPSNPGKEPMNSWFKNWALMFRNTGSWGRGYWDCYSSSALGRSLLGPQRVLF